MEKSRFENLTIQAGPKEKSSPAGRGKKEPFSLSERTGNWSSAELRERSPGTELTLNRENKLENHPDW
jgi:hypothetical protein